MGLVAKHHGTDISTTIKESRNIVLLADCWVLRLSYQRVNNQEKSATDKVKDFFRPSFDKTWEPTIKEPTQLPFTPKRASLVVMSELVRK